MLTLRASAIAIGQMGRVRQSMPSAGLKALLAGLLWLALATRTEASPYYTATYVGNSYTQSANSITDSDTGVSYAFVTTTTPIPSYVSGAPSATITTSIEGQNGTQQVPMQIQGINASGTIIGDLAAGVWSAPWSAHSSGYAVKLPDGSYSAFVPLDPGPNPSNELPMYLSQSNRILFYDPTNPTIASLANVSTGVITPVSQLISPSLAQQFQTLYPLAIDDRGDLLVNAYSGNAAIDGAYPHPVGPDPARRDARADIAGGVRAPRHNRRRPRGRAASHFPRRELVCCHA